MKTSIKYSLVIGIMVVMIVGMTAVLSLTSTGKDNEERMLKGVDRSTYPDSMKGYQSYSSNSTEFKVILVIDNDKSSKNVKKNGEIEFLSRIEYGILQQGSPQWTYKPLDGGFELSTKLNYDGRGNELSELVQFYDNVYAFEDKTGVVSVVDRVHEDTYPFVIIADGNGYEENGAKHEWATIVNDTIIVGSHGKDVIDVNGDEERKNKYYINKIYKNGFYMFEDWTDVYTLIEETLQVGSKGYVTHEAVTYCYQKDKWYFAPRKCSSETFETTDDEMHRACKKIVQLDGNLQNPIIIEDPQYNESRCFASMKSIPYHEDYLVYIKSYEVDGDFESWIGMMDTQGNIIMEEVSIGKNKFEGIEIIPLN